VDHKMKMDHHQGIRKERTDCTEMHKQTPEGIPSSLWGTHKAAGKVLLPVVSTTSWEGGRPYIVTPHPPNNLPAKKSV